MCGFPDALLPLSFTCLTRFAHSRSSSSDSRALFSGRFVRSCGPECEQVFQHMMAGVQHHVKEEESELLPKAQQQLGAERLGALMQERKQALQYAQPTAGG